jgi:hypothetical protein
MGDVLDQCKLTYRIAIDPPMKTTHTQLQGSMNPKKYQVLNDGDQHMSRGQNEFLNLMPCTNEGRPLSVVRISVLLEVSQMGYRYRVVPYRL